MYKIQFPEKGQKVGFGARLLRLPSSMASASFATAAAVYGFSTEFVALPDDKLGVIVCSSKDVTNAVTSRIANTALKQMLALKAGKALPKLENSSRSMRRLRVGWPDATVPILRTRHKGKWDAEAHRNLRTRRQGVDFPNRAGAKFEIRQDVGRSYPR